MSFTTAQVEAMRNAIATGALTVRNANGEMVTYRSLSEMKDVLGMMEASVSGAPRTAYVNPVFDRGL